MIRLGIFDSGIGGLTVYNAMRRAMPAADIRYFGDTARVPYGTKSAETVTRFALQIARHLVRQEVDAVIVACNTASAYALDALRAELRVPVFGVVEPGARAAAQATRNRIVGVAGTRGTIESGAYQRALHAIDPRIAVVTAACPLFVPLVEEGWIDDPVTREVAVRYLAPLIEAEVDTLVLGCTHYPMLREVLGTVMGPGVTLIDSADEVSLQVVGHFRDEPRAAAPRAGSDLFEVTDSAERFAQIGAVFLHHDLDRVVRVDISALE